MPQRAKILIVEDDALIGQEMAERVERLGYAALGPAHTLEAAEQAAARERPDAALLDGTLHGRSSVEFGAALAAAGVPIAFCTGDAFIRGLPPQLAAVAVLLKPVSDEQLRAVLAKMLGR